MSARVAAWLSILIPVVLLVSAWPFGDTRVNDDWQMYWSAFEFARTGDVRIPTYSAMGMVGWSVPGGVVAALCGESFLLLRCLTLATLPLTGWLAYDTAREWDLPADRSLFVSLLVSTTPVLFWLSTTYMTDAPWHAAWALGLWAWTRALKRGASRDFVVGALAVTWAAWVRLPIVALPLGMIAAVLWTRADAVIGKRAWIAFGASLLLGPVAFWVWYRYVHGATWAYEYKSQFSAEDILLRTPSGVYATIAYTGCFLFPAAPWLIRRSQLRSRPALAAAGALGALALVQAKFGILVGINAKMPYLRNIAYNLGLGPINLTDTAREGGPPPFHLSGWTQIGVSVVVAVVGAALVWIAAVRLIRALRARENPLMIFAGVSVLLYLGAATMFSKPSAPLFDRYIVMLILPVVLVLAQRDGGADEPGRPRPGLAPCWALLALVAVYSTAGTSDFHRYNDARFRLGRRAVEAAGTTFRVDAGAAFNLYHNYEPSTRGEFVHPKWWKGWLAYPEYVVATREREGFEVVDREPVFFLLGWKHWDLLLLHQVGEDR